MRVKFTFSSRKTRKIDPHNKHRQEYPSLAKEVIISSDLILEILDARFINETRNFMMEEFAREHGKILISCKVNHGRRQLREIIKMQAKNFKRAKKKLEKGPEVAESPDTHLELHKQGIG